LGWAETMDADRQVKMKVSDKKFFMTQSSFSR